MIETFIRENLRLHWQPGRVDCLLVLADWAIWNGYPDPAAHLRKTYDSEEGFHAIISHAGGVVPLVESCASKIGLQRTNERGLGVIGVVGSPENIQRQWGALWDGEGWRVRFTDKFPRVSARPLAMWRL